MAVGFYGPPHQVRPGTKDANGFVTVQNNGGSMSQAASFFHGQSFMYSSGNPTGDNVPDFNNFEGDPIKVPNDAAQISLQTVFGGGQSWSIIKLSRLLSARSTPVRPRSLAWIRIAA